MGGESGFADPADAGDQDHCRPVRAKASLADQAYRIGASGETDRLCRQLHRPRWFLRRRADLAREHPAVQGLQFGARIHPEILGEHGPGTGVDLQRLGLSAGTRERGHQLSLQAFPQWVGFGDESEFGEDLGFPAEQQFGFEADLGGGDPLFGELLPACLGEAAW